MGPTLVETQFGNRAVFGSLCSAESIDISSQVAIKSYSAELSPLKAQLQQQAQLIVKPIAPKNR
jgi:hypothetical protein